jgi:4-hydroxy-tetrahydrodipicolinate synthase
MAKKKLSGIFTALVTPFNQGKVDFACFRDLCKRQINAGVTGLVPCGTTGETPTLNTEEWEQLIRIAVEEADGKVLVIAGCGTNATHSTCQNIRRVKELGADAGLVVFPYYNKPNPEGLLVHVTEAGKEDLPIVLYHVPGRTGQRLSADLLEQLCRLPNVIGLKEATGDVTLGQELCNRLADTDISLLSGDDFTYAALCAMGFDGAISVLSNPAPELSVEWFDVAQTGSIPRLRELRSLLLPVVSTLFSSSNPLPCKAIMNKQGLLQNEARLPLRAIELEESTDWSFLR